MSFATLLEFQHRLEMLDSEGNVQTDAQQVVFMQNALNESTRLIDGIVGYSLERGTHVEYVDNLSGSDILELRHGPIVSVTSVKQVAAGVVGDTVAASEYSIRGLLDDAQSWTLPGSLLRHTLSWNQGRRVYEATYVAGWAVGSIPEDLVSGCLNAATFIKNKRKDMATGGRNVGAGYQSYMSGMDDMRKEVAAIVARHIDVR